MSRPIFHYREYTVKAIHEQLLWQKRHPDCPTTPEDRVVRKLLYGEQRSEMGLVCETSFGDYWAFTTNPNIACMPPAMYLIRHTTIAKAASQLEDYVAGEVLKLIEQSQPPITRKLKRRDREAFLARRTSLDSSADAFKSGAEWILRSEGFPRRPEWAHYLAQDEDGLFHWFEAIPSPNETTGKWEAPEGRVQSVKDRHPWQTHVVELI